MITSNQNEQVKYWASLNEKKNRDKYKEYIIEGEHLILEAYKNGYLKTVLYKDKLNIKLDNIEVIEVSDNVIKKISNTVTPQGIIGIVRYFDDESIDLNKRVVALDDVQDPGNAGTIVRNSLAFGYNLVFFSNNSVDIYNPKFIRATQGYFYFLKIIRGDIKEFILKLIENNYDIISTYLDNSSNNINNIETKEKHCVVMGNEGKGVNPNILSMCHEYIYIPMNSKCESLNVGVATSIILYEMR